MYPQPGTELLYLSRRTYVCRQSRDRVKRLHENVNVSIDPFLKESDVKILTISHIPYMRFLVKISPDGIK